MRIKLKLPKPRNPVAAAMSRSNATKPRVIRDKTRYTRKIKHKLSTG